MVVHRIVSPASVRVALPRCVAIDGPNRWWSNGPCIARVRLILPKWSFYEAVPRSRHRANRQAGCLDRNRFLRTGLNNLAGAEQKGEFTATGPEGFGAA